MTTGRTVLPVALLLATFGVNGMSAEVGAQPPRPLRYVTLNLLHGGVLSGLTGHDDDLGRRLEIIVDELRALRPDILGLQEASTGRSRGNVAQRLATRLGFHYVYAPAQLRVFPGEWLNRLADQVLNFTEGPAIVSRFPILAWEAHRLPRCGHLTDPRVLLFARLTTPWGPLPVFSTHTSGDACHARRVAELVRERRGPLPAVLMGDFNAVETSPAITALTAAAGFRDVFRAANPTQAGPTVWQRVTAPEPMARSRVDYLFLMAGTDVPGTILGSRVVLNAPRRLPGGGTLWPSDHYGVMADLAVFPLAPARMSRHEAPDRDGAPDARPRPEGPVEQDPGE